MTALEISALRAAERSREGKRGDAGFGDLATDCAARLRTRLARPRRAAGDWPIELPESDLGWLEAKWARGALSERSGRCRLAPEDEVIIRMPQFANYRAG